MNHQLAGKMDPELTFQQKNIAPELYIEPCQPLIEILKKIAKEINTDFKKFIWYYDQINQKILTELGGKYLKIYDSNTQIQCHLSNRIRS